MSLTEATNWFMNYFLFFLDAIRCFECRSDVQRNCGDPFFPGSVPSTECTHINNNPSFMCFKASQYGTYHNTWNVSQFFCSANLLLSYHIIYIYFTVGGTYITVRGCAPFDSITFNRGMQRQMVGTYWKGFNIFSLCDYDQCNGARNLGGLSLFSSMILLLVHKLF